MGAGAREPGLATTGKGGPVCTEISLIIRLSEPSLPNGVAREEAQEGWQAEGSEGLS